MATPHTILDLHPQFQADVNFDRLQKEGVKGVIIKATEGATFVADGLREYQERAAAQGLRTGFYHFLRPEPGRSGAREAEHFWRAVKGAGAGQGELIRLVADVEATKLGVTATLTYTRQFIERLKDLADHEPILYTFPHFIENWGPHLGALRLWIAHYRVEKPLLPEPFVSYVLWQFTDAGQVPGVAGNVDVNKCPRLSDITLSRSAY